MLTQRALRLLCLVASLVLSASWPARAEYHWNPFVNMTEADATGMLVLVLLVATCCFFGWPLLLGAVTYAVLEQTHPLASAKVSRALLYACLVGWAGLLVRFLTAFFDVNVFGYASNILLFTSPIIGAAFGYFRHRSKPAA